ncbi:MAG: hypothetical protein KGP12_05755 [Actinomycetales bacterium]|nr:hypothetical protein [Actinomycetales bacterium]
MGLINAAVVWANEEGGAAHASTPAWAFGVFAFGALVVALIVTMMIKVGD